MASDDEVMGQLAAQDAAEAAALRMRRPYSQPVEGPGIGGGIGQLAEPLVSQPSWLEKAQAESARNAAALQQGGPGAMFQLDPGPTIDLAGGFGGVTKAVGKPVMGALADVAAPPFYSAAGRAVDAAKLGKGTPEQWTGYLRNQPGVKPEELERVFGNLPQGGPLTKEQMQAHAAENAVTLGEVSRGSPDYAATAAIEAERSAVRAQLNEARQQFALDPTNREVTRSRVAELADRDQALTDQIVGAQGKPPKYSQWQLPGGENYREKLLTLPQKPLSEGFSIVQKPDGKWSLQNPSGQQLTSARTRAELDDVVRSNPGWFPSFRSSHWDEPNVLAHIRMNDREVPGVGKSLHLEEIQSDWHQKGRSEGYAGKEFYVKNEASGNKSQPFKTEAEAEAFRQTLPPRTANQTLVESRNTPGIPDAPFKSTWADVSLKRAIRDAAEGGYDALSWTPGEAQAARYDLSKQVNQLDLTHNRDGIGKLGMTLKDGSRQYVDITSRENLADTVGKDVAEKLYKQGAENNGVAVLSGLDLKIGGEGMKAFYDKMLVDKANALGKKHGARVEQSEIRGQPFKGYQSYSAGEGPTGAPALFGVDHTGAGRIVRQNFSTIDEARAAAAELNQGGERSPVHVLRITPELRAAAMKGFPLFTAAGGVMGGLAAQDNYE